MEKLTLDHGHPTGGDTTTGKDNTSEQAYGAKVTTVVARTIGHSRTHS